MANAAMKPASKARRTAHSSDAVVRPVPKRSAVIQPFPGSHHYPLSVEQRQMRRHRLWRTSLLQVLLTLVVAFGSVGGAVLFTRVLLRGVSLTPAAHVIAQSTGVHTAPPATAVPPVYPVPVGSGATLSFQGIAITVTLQTTIMSSGPIVAPPGQEFVLLTIHLVNTMPAPMRYNAYDFVLSDGSSPPHHQDFAALADALQVGTLPAEGQVSGIIAFLITPGGADPQVLYAPSIAAGDPLVWNVPLATTQALP